MNEREKMPVTSFKGFQGADYTLATFRGQYVVLTLLKCVIREFLCKNHFLDTTKLLGANPNVSKG